MPQVGGKKFPYTKKGVAAAKKVAAEKREAMQKKNRAAAGKASQRAAALDAVGKRRLKSYRADQYAGVKNNRMNAVEETSWNSGASLQGDFRRSTSDALQGGYKKQGTRNTKSRMAARRAGAR